MATKPRCECGKAILSNFQASRGRCATCEKKRDEQRYAEARAIVASNECPQCKAPIVRNLALTGWYQCAAYGEPYMRKAEHASLPKCSFQTFTQ